MAGIKTKDVWDKVDVMAGVLAEILIPIVIAIATVCLNNSLRERELDAQEAGQKRYSRLRIFEVEIGILQKDPKSTPEISAFSNLKSDASGWFFCQKKSLNTRTGSRGFSGMRPSFWPSLPSARNAKQMPQHVLPHRYGDLHRERSGKVEFRDS